MANTVKLKRSAVAGDAPSASDLEIGEVAINTADGLLYTKHTDGTINKITIADDELSALLSGYTTATDATSSDLIVFYDVTAGVWERSTIANAALQGEKGQKGQAGADGDKGQKGEVGSKGQKGEVGATGNDGSNGSDGDKGQKGQAGNDGSAGSNGAKGQKGEVGVQGNDGSNGDKGQKGQKGEVGANGSNGSDGANGQKGEKGQKGQDGTAGGDGSDGDKGQKGEVGAKGQKGQEGSFGGATFDYTFSTNTADSDPTSGKLKFNNANLSSASKMYIDNQDGSATSIVTFLRTIDDSTSTIKGHFRVSNRLNADDFALFTIGGSITEATGYVKVNCSYVSGSATSFSNSEDIIITFARTGDAGDTGAAGASGSDGNDGAKGQKGQKGQTGAAGSNGSNGSKGQKGEVGAAGSNGSNGSDGAAGQKGQKGEVGANGSNGSNGSKGQKGQKGEVGANGSNGSNGSKGQKGQKGEVGAGGSDGSNGSKGEKGQKGQTGGSGSDGSDGDKGQKGQKGQAGSTGGTGAKGQKGQKGQTGAGGGTGSKGQKGEGGLTTTNADTLDNYDSSRFFRRQSKANATVGGGWMTVLENTSGRVSGEIIVTDGDSGDHAYIRIHYMRSYNDANFTVINCGGHSNKITGARILYQTSDNTYGKKKLQVYVTTSSNYEVNLYELGDIADYGIPSLVTPVIENSISGYAVHGNEITGLETWSVASEEGIQAPTLRATGDIYLGDQIIHEGDTDTYLQFHAADQFRVVTGGTERLEVSNGTTLISNTLNMNNNNITNVNALYINDPGPSEGIKWNGGNEWQIYESPDNLSTNGSGNLQFTSGGGNGTMRMRVDTSGNFTAQGNVTAYSDERLKQNIETLDGAKVYEMRGVSFTKDGSAGSGVIAQELQKVAPELVQDSDEYLSVAYGNLVGYLIETVKELNERVKTLEAKLEKD